MATAAKISSGFVAIVMLVICFPGAVDAMQVGSLQGTTLHGWYKDSFSVTIQYGNGTCTGPGTQSTFTYHPNPSYDGQHIYYFMSDIMDNPYVAVDGPPPQLLISPAPCPVATTSYIPAQNFTIPLDTQPPTVSITSPSGNLTTPLMTYDISGTANDTASGVETVQLFDDGIAGQAVTPNGTTFSLTANLHIGQNNIIVQATDRVGHTSQSNVVVITRQTVSTNGGITAAGSTNNNQPSPSAQSSVPSAPMLPAAGQPVASAAGTNPAKLNFLDGLPITVDSHPIDRPSDPTRVLEETGFPSANGLLMGLLLGLVAVLIIANILVIWHFRPVFARLDRSNSGLRRRIIIIVTLPSLLPVFGLGFLAYQQLSISLKAALSQELARAAQTSAIKLEREFSIRRDVITTNSSDIFQIKNQFKQHYTQLAQQHSSCYALMQSAIPAGRFATVSTSENCLPFLGVLAQLTNYSGTSLHTYLTALDDGYANTLKGLKADEQQRTDSLLASIRAYFPDTTELAVIANDLPATIITSLPAVGSYHPVLKAHTDLLRQASTESKTLFDAGQAPGQVLFTYPIVDSMHTLVGQTVVAFNTGYPAFIPAIWQATPKPYASDKVYFLSDAGYQIYPVSGDRLTQPDARKISNVSPGMLVDVPIKQQILATRVSPVLGSNWTVAVGAPPATILAPVANVQRVALLAIASFLLLSLLLGIVFVSSIATEIEALYQGANRFAKGEFDYIISLGAHDELRVLGETMNHMATDIKTAQAALMAKDKEFINITSHELKAPMTAILGNLSMVVEDGVGAVDSTARGLIEQAYIGTKRLKALVTDLLDVARLEAGKAQFTITPIDITKLTTENITLQQTPAKEATITVHYQPEANLPFVLADDNKLRIIVTNLVSNAIKYNKPNGTITIEHSLKDGFLITSVADTGLGIPADQQNHIFEKFYRVNHEDRTNVPGTGLGMYITKHFIEGMGGRVWFTSNHGQGTTFYFTLPIAAENSLQPHVTNGSIS